MTKGQVIKQFYCKAKNRRIWIELRYFNEDPKPYLFRIAIKTYKGGRNINLVENWYSPETFVLLSQLMGKFIDTQVSDIICPELFGNAENFVFNELKKHIDDTTTI